MVSILRMYQNHYGLHESPFRLTTDTKFVYWSQAHQSAYRHLLYSVESHKSLIVLAGAVGTGKTTLLHVLNGNGSKPHANSPHGLRRAFHPHCGRAVSLYLP